MSAGPGTPPPPHSSADAASESPEPSHVHLRRAAWTLLLVGAALRVWQCATHGSLWADEAGLGLNLVGRQLSEVARPFVFNQVTPYLFLIAEKLTTLVFGESDFALRLLPLLAGIAVLPLTAALAYRVIGMRGAVVALLLLLPADRLVHYSQELKPYTGDAAIAGALLLLAQLTQVDTQRRKVLHALGLAGVIAPWLSLPSVFTLAGIGVALIADAWLTQRDRARTLVLLGYGALWLVSFGVHFRLFLTVAATDTGTQDYYRVMNDFAPFPPRSLADLRWYVGRAFYSFLAPGSFQLRYLAGGLFVAGCILAWRKQRWLALMFFLPWVAVFAGSALKRYPLAERMLLFLLPSMFCMIALALTCLLMRERLVWPVLSALAIAGLLVAPTWITVATFRLHFERPGLEDVMVELQHDLTKGDGIFVDRSNRWGYLFYAQRLGIKAPFETAASDVVAADPRGDNEYYRVLDGFAGNPRVWALIPTVGGRLPDSARAVGTIRWAEGRLRKRLDELGTKLASYDAGNATLYLYDMSRSAAARP